MIIAVDYDDTYTRDPDLWAGFLRVARNLRGHTAICVTCRYEHNERIAPSAEELFERVIYTGRKAKKPYLEALGIFPDIWVDDSPNFILFDSGGEYRFSSLDDVFQHPAMKDGYRIWQNKTDGEYVNSGTPWPDDDPNYEYLGTIGELKNAAKATDA